MENIDSQLIKYRPPKGKIEVDVRFQENSVWLTQTQMSELFGKNKRTISEHVNNIFKEGELKEKYAIRNIRTSAADGKVYKTNHYNFDVIISVGYRVKSPGITPFRYWVNEQLGNGTQSKLDKNIDSKLREIEADIEDLLNKIKTTTL